MAFLRVGLSSDVGTLHGRAIVLRPPQVSDYMQWAELRALSRAHLTPWEPMWPRDDLTKTAFRRRVKHYQKEARDDLGYAYLIFSAEGERLVGGLSLSHVRRGVTQAATLGYWLGLPHVGQGHMTEAVRTVLGHAFGRLRLHRIDAAVQPNNARSVRVLERVGFRHEGLARRYLKINGAWQDHLLYALIAEEWDQGGMSQA